MYKSIPTWTHSQTSSSRSTKLKDILPWNISQMITKTIPVSTRIVMSHAIFPPPLEFWSLLSGGNWSTGILNWWSGKLHRVSFCQYSIFMGAFDNTSIKRMIFYLIIFIDIPNQRIVLIGFPKIYLTINVRTKVCLMT